MVWTIILVFALISMSGLEGSPLKFHPRTLHAHVTHSDAGEWVVIEGQPTKYRPTIAEVTVGLGTNTSGWNFLYAWTNGSYSDVEQAYTAGYLEGRTDPLIHLQYMNSMSGQCTTPSTPFCQRMHAYLSANLNYTMKKIILKRRSDPFWHQVELMLWQIQGMEDAFKERKMRLAKDLHTNKLNLDPFGVFFWHVKGGDSDELSEALKSSAERTPIKDRAGMYGHCSALIKVASGTGQLFVAQDTWGPYEMMLRYMKLYEFNYHETADPTSPFVPVTSESFSSYPGSIVSGDDFYVLSSKMVSQETTIGFYNNSLYDIIRYSEDTVFEFIRSQVANRLARNIAEWNKYFAYNNSGTYNNQWMVVDYKKVKTGAPLPSSGVLGVSEQLPGLVVWKDMTQHLRNYSYWPSYNSPAFPEIIERSNLSAMVKTFGNFFDYNATPRARIFRRDHVKVVDETTMIRLMRYNDFKNDPMARCKCSPPYSGENGISARSDLNPANGTYPFGALGHRNHGGIDMKLTTPWLLDDLGFIGVSSPTYDQQPVFKWSTSGFKVSHFGQPDRWDFPPIISPWRRIRGWSPYRESFEMHPDNIIIVPY